MGMIFDIDKKPRLNRIPVNGILKDVFSFCICDACFFLQDDPSYE